MLISIGKIRFRDTIANAEMIPLVPLGLQAEQQITKAVSITQLAEHHAEHLMPTSKLLHFVIAIIAVNTFYEIICIQEGDYLGKNILTRVHASNLSVSKLKSFEP